MVRDLSARDSVLESILIGGLEPLRVELHAHDPVWAVTYERHDAAIRGALGATALNVEHIGSTSIPGMVAKPVVDVLLTVPDVDAEQQYVPALANVGFTLRARLPGHRMLRTAAHDVNLHVLRPGDQQVQDYLDLRDWLRQDADDRALYAATKKLLAQQEWPDMHYYSMAKSEVLAEILTRARTALRPLP